MTVNTKEKTYFKPYTSVGHVVAKDIDAAREVVEHALEKTGFSVLGHTTNWKPNMSVLGVSHKELLEVAESLEGKFADFLSLCIRIALRKVKYNGDGEDGTQFKLTFTTIPYWGTAFAAKEYEKGKVKEGSEGNGEGTPNRIVSVYQSISCLTCFNWTLYISFESCCIL